MENQATLSVHTPGPWKVIGPYVAHTVEHDIEGLPSDIELVKRAPWHTNDADLRLMAAAPDLLDALRLCVAQLAVLKDVPMSEVLRTGHIAAISRARYAIAKAA